MDVKLLQPLVSTWSNCVWSQRLMDGRDRTVAKSGGVIAPHFSPACNTTPLTYSLTSYTDLPFANIISFDGNRQPKFLNALDCDNARCSKRQVDFIARYSPTVSQLVLMHPSRLAYRELLSHPTCPLLHLRSGLADAHSKLISTRSGNISISTTSYIPDHHHNAPRAAPHNFRRHPILGSYPFPRLLRPHPRMSPQRRSHRLLYLPHRRGLETRPHQAELMVLEDRRHKSNTQRR
jgi:hypothetical protein